MWQAHRAKPHRQTEKVLLGQVQEPVAFQAPIPSELVEYKNGGVSTVWERVPGKPGDAKTEEVLQPRLCKPGASKESK